jgi:hypothetical protein
MGCDVFSSVSPGDPSNRAARRRVCWFFLGASRP